MSWWSGWSGGGGSSSGGWGGGWWKSQSWSAWRPGHQQDSRKRKNSGWSAKEGGWKWNPLPPSQIVSFFFNISERLLQPGLTELNREFKEDYDTTIVARGRRSGGATWVLCDIDNDDWRWRSWPRITIRGPCAYAAFTRCLELIKDAGGDLDSVTPLQTVKISTAKATQTSEVEVISSSSSSEEEDDQAAPAGGGGGGAQETEAEEEEEEEEEMAPKQGESSGTGGVAPPPGESSGSGGMAPPRGSGGMAPPQGESSGSGSVAPPQGESGGSGGMAPPQSKSGDRQIHFERLPVHRECRPGSRYPAPTHLLSLAETLQEKFPKHQSMFADLKNHVNSEMVTSFLEKRLKIAFCTTTLKRQFQTKQALAHQLLTLWPYQEYCKLFLVDFAQTESESLQEWVMEHMQEAIDCGLLQYYRCRSIAYWHASICKNVAHYCATDWSNILVNLDTDYLFHPSVVSEILHAYEQQPLNTTKGSIFIDISNEMIEGSCGCIAASTHTFTQLRGYDEDFLPSSVQDVDLKKRLKMAGARRIHIWSPSMLGFSIPNVDPDKLKLKIAFESSRLLSSRQGGRERRREVRDCCARPRIFRQAACCATVF